MMSEEDVGILCYMNTLPGFRGTLKQRYADFVVNEVSSTGEVIRLTNLDPPPAEPCSQSSEKSSTASAIEEVSGKPAEKSASENPENIEAFRALVGKEDVDQLEALLKRISEMEVDVSPVLLAPDSDKAHRAAVHNFFKSRLPFLVTDTVDGPGDVATSKCVRVRYFAGRSEGAGRGQGNKRDGEWRDRKSKRQKGGHSGKNGFPFDIRREDGPSQKFLLFHLFKENKNTNDALMVIGRMLGIQPKSFGFAGTKDKRAVTTQQVTVFRQSAAKVSSLNARLFGIKVGNFSYREKSLGLGELSGNHFTITLRNVIAESDAAIAEAVEGLRERGFVNYYGLQRFGNTAVATHTVGAALFRGEWKNAVELILQPRDGEPVEVSDARNFFQKTRDINGALLKFPRHMSSERALLGGLKKQPGNWLMAFNCIPRPMRLMFVHSYQSYLWNRAASYRLRTFGEEAAVEGDLVYFEQAEHDSLQEAKVETKVEFTAGDEAEEEVDAFDSDHVFSEGMRKVKHVTAEDVAQGRYTIADVVLPLPGSLILYPKNSTASVYSEVANQDSVDLAQTTHSVKEYSILQLTGGYRSLVRKLKDFEWKLLPYSDMTTPLSETDLDSIVKNSKQAEREKLENTNGSNLREEKKIETGIDLIVNGSGQGEERKLSTKKDDGEIGKARKALQLRFTLPASSYATMAIRELLKTSTSVAFHKSLNEEVG